MGTISYTIPSAGSTLNSIADPEVATALQTLLTWANGNIDAVNVSALLAQAAGVNQSGQTVKGAANIAASESRTNVAYGTLTTPDQVTGIVLPTNGLLAVWYQAIWASSVAGAGNAAIFLGSNQLQAVQSSGATAPTVQAATSNANAGISTVLGTIATGLGTGAQASNYTGDVATGQVQTVTSGFTGPCYIFAAAGTYTVSIQFKASSGSVTALNRKLWVQALSFS